MGTVVKVVVIGFLLLSLLALIPTLISPALAVIDGAFDTEILQIMSMVWAIIPTELLNFLRVSLGVFLVGVIIKWVFVD